jgi:hypothetical protein
VKNLLLSINPASAENFRGFRYGELFNSLKNSSYFMYLTLKHLIFKLEDGGHSFIHGGESCITRSFIICTLHQV